MIRLALPSPSESNDLAEPADDTGDPPSDGDQGSAGSLAEGPPSPPLLQPLSDAGLDESAASEVQDPPSGAEPEPQQEEPEADAGPPAEEVPVPEPPEEEEPVPDPPPVAPPPDSVNGCSEVQFCEAFRVIDTTDGVRCIQHGCSLEAAAAECRAEVQVYCGNAPPPFALYTLDGGRLELQ